MKMASAQVVETSVTNISSSQDANHPDDLFQSKFESNSSLARCEIPCLTDPLDYKYRGIYVLVLGVISTLRSAVG